MNMPANQNQNRQISPVQRMTGILSSESVQNQFKNALGDNASIFVASIIDVYSSDTYLQKCDPKTVVMEALKAATLKLPINKNLGFAYIVPYAGKATMQIGYKGLVQLAQRTGHYRYINAGKVFEGEMVGEDKLTGQIDMSGGRTSDVIVGYFAYIELLNGFKKTEFWTTEEIHDHAKKFSQSYSKGFSPWKKHFDRMAIKTVLKSLMSTYGIMSVEMSSVMSSEAYTPQDEIDMEANQGEMIDINEVPPEQIESPKEPGPMTDEEKTAIQAEEAAGADSGPQSSGPDF